MSEHGKPHQVSGSVKVEDLKPKGEPFSLRQPTEDNLKKDAISIAGQIEGMWEGEVECVVVLVPRAKPLTPRSKVPYATTVRDQAKYRAMVDAIRNVPFNVVKPAGKV